MSNRFHCSKDGSKGVGNRSSPVYKNKGQDKRAGQAVREIESMSLLREHQWMQAWRSCCINIHNAQINHNNACPSNEQSQSAGGATASTSRPHSQPPCSTRHSSRKHRTHGLRWTD